MKVYVLLLNWNGCNDTLECLDSVFKSDYADYSVIVCDNNSSDNSIAEITHWAKNNLGERAFTSLTEKQVASDGRMPANSKLTLVINSANHGFAGGNNVGIRLAMKNDDCKYVWLLNNDTVIATDAMRFLVEKIVSDDRIGMCGSLLCFYHDRNMVQAVGGVNFSVMRARGTQLGQGLSIDSDSIESLAAITPTYIAGASMLVRQDLILDIGYMEDKYFLYFEEIDWSTRCAPSWKLATACKSIVYHKEGGSIGTSSLKARSALSQYYLNRNLILFYLKYYRLLVPIAILRVVREAASTIRNGNYSLFGVTCRALFDGLLQRDGMKK